ncbi:MAG: ABC transporter permease [Armatimonadetes bacterium]|nr:ABC transporter permease [Armatimonadota bacterium]
MNNFILDNCLHAFRALKLNWLRSFLTMTGITVGMLAIVTLVAVLQGVKAEIEHEVDGLGANLVIIVPGKLDENGIPNPMAMIGVSPLTQKDLTALKGVPGLEKVSPVLFVGGTVEGDKKKTATGLVVGTNRDGVIMNPTPLQEGRYFEDSETGKNLCILGAKQKDELFPKTSAIGKQVTIADKKWTIVGVLSKPQNDGTMGNAMLGLSDFVYLPEGAVRRDVTSAQMNRIVLKTDYLHPAEQMIDTMMQTLMKVHDGKEEFGIITQKKGLSLVIKLVGMAQALLVLIAAISLFVAGVGIMNIMLVTVTERTREIGIRKTVGAKQRDIFWQFLTEAVVLSILGGVLGLGLSTVICKLIARFSQLTPIITPPVIVMGMVLCLTVGVIFGVAPALRAARLSPIDALRYE